MNSTKLIRLPFGQHPRLASRQTTSQHDHVLRKLGLGIVSGEFPENSILPGDLELLRQLSVSRTVLREALKVLAAKGLVQAKTKVGTKVMGRQYWNLFDSDVLYWCAESGVDAEFLANLSEMRFMFEPEAAALAAVRRSEEHLIRLHDCVEMMGSSRSSPVEFVEWDLRFHLAVAEASGNPLMRSFSSVIEVALAITFTISSPLPNSELHATTVARHGAVVDAIGAGDQYAARAAMRVVIAEGVKRTRDVTSRGSVPA